MTCGGVSEKRADGLSELRWFLVIECMCSVWDDDEAAIGQQAGYLVGPALRDDHVARATNHQRRNPHVRERAFDVIVERVLERAQDALETAVAVVAQDHERLRGRFVAAIHEPPPQL